VHFQDIEDETYRITEASFPVPDVTVAVDWNDVGTWWYKKQRMELPESQKTLDVMTAGWLRLVLSDKYLNCWVEVPG
jgi:hypothetical protein